MAAIAASTSRVRIGSLVTGNTYRHPAVLAKMAAQVDIISNGRLVLGLGAGWQENEHEAYGIDFHTLGGRMRRLEESAQIIKSLFQNDRTDFHGRAYTITDAPLAPKPDDVERSTFEILENKSVLEVRAVDIPELDEIRASGTVEVTITARANGIIIGTSTDVEVTEAVPFEEFRP